MHDALVDTLTPETVERALASTLRPSVALFFHTRTSHGKGHAVLGLVTAHGVSPGPSGAATVGPGRPLLPEDEARMLTLLLGRQQEQAPTVYPSNLLYSSACATTWWIAPSVRPMWLRDHDDGLRTIETRWPNLVATARGRSLYLAALEGDARPNASSRLFHAPLPNVYADGRLCTGSATLPAGARVADIAGWERVIHDSAWTHTNHRATLTQPTRSGSRARKAKAGRGAEADAQFWSARNGVQEHFPDALLNPKGCTLAQWLAALHVTTEEQA